MDFDSRPGIKFLMQHICQTNMSANLYQMSALVWCVQFVVNFALCCSDQHRNEDCLTVLEELFSEITIIYGQKVRLINFQQQHVSLSQEDNTNSSKDDGSRGRRISWPSSHKLPFFLQKMNPKETIPFALTGSDNNSNITDEQMAKVNPFNNNNNSGK